MDRDTMKNKIKKLLALANDNDSDAESFSALQKAQALMVEYKISEGELNEEDKVRECIQKKTTFSYGSRSSDTYMNTLASIIAENFCCIHYLSTLRGTQTRYIAFMGYEEDVEVCIEAMRVANSAIVKGYNKVYKDLCKRIGRDYVPTRLFNPHKEGYVDGYLAGLEHALNSQKEKNQEWALVLVAPQEATDFLATLGEIQSSRTILTNHSYYDDGYNDGTKFQLTKKLDSTQLAGALE